MRRAARYLSLFGPLVVVLVLSKVHAAYVANPAYDYTGSFRFTWSLGYAALLAVTAYGAGLPELARTSRQAAATGALASVGGALGVSVLQLLVGDALLPRFVVLGSALLAIPVHVVAASMSQRGRSQDEWRDRVAFVGAATEAETLRAELEGSVERPATVVRHLSTPEAVSASSVHKPLIDAVIDSGATVLVLDRGAMLDSSVVDQSAPLHESGVRVRTLLEFYEGWLGKLPVGELERASLFFDIGEIHRLRYGRVKRLVDLAGATLGLVPLLLIIPVVVVGNLIGNRGPLFYRQERVGRGGEGFAILKFRTMAPTGSGVIDTSWTTVGDARITPFGALLRRSHLDELPQVVNILRGELSIVGPRPEQPRYVTELSAKLPFYGMRHLVRPGLTGWAQVKYGYAGDEDDAVEKLQYEFFYLRRQSLRFDLRVIGRTVRSVLGSEGSGR